MSIEIAQLCKSIYDNQLQQSIYQSMVKSRSHYDVAHLQPPTNVPINFLHLTVSEIQPGQTFSRRYRSATLLCYS